jgi:trk system potassium uptake protein TrkH
MSRKRLAHVIGAVVAAVGASMLLPVVMALIYREGRVAVEIGAAAVVVTVIGLAVWRLVPAPGPLSTADGFAIVGLAWIAMTLFGTLPYVFTGELGSFTDSAFETAAGFSTTGASVVPDPAGLSHGILFWRSLTQWLGGMGIIVLSVAILPLLGVGGVQLARAESPGPAPDRLTPRFSETAKRLWLLYVIFTVVEAGLLWAAGLTLFDAMNYALTTMSTGGFGTQADSFSGFSALAQWIAIAFMFIAGTSFALHFRALRKPIEYTRSSEFRLYVTILGVASIVTIIGTWGSPIADGIRNSIFTIVSIVTTTGYVSADYELWPIVLQVMILGLMFVGGMAGSTGGSVKPFRLGVLVSASRADLRKTIHSRGIFPVRLGRDPVPDEIVRSVQSFFLLYMFLFMTGTVLLALIIDLMGADLDIITSTSAVASSLGNVGPGLGDVGPTSTYAVIPGPGKWLLIFLMIVGRLEIYPVLLLFTRDLWRR